MSEQQLRSRCRRAGVPAAIALICCVFVPATALATHNAGPRGDSASTHEVHAGKGGGEHKGSSENPATSPELWATVDICNASDQPDTVGIRGSMPAGPDPKAQMYMRFQIQYLVTATNTWTDLSGGGSSWQKVGQASSVRQAGQTFHFVPTLTGEGAFTVRGEVSFQWRKGGAAALTLTRTTTSGHKSLAGADPAGFSSASCAIS